MTRNADHGHMKKGRARAALTGVFWSGMTSLTPTLVAALVFLLTSRVLAPADFGLVAFAAALVATIAVFSPAGFSDAIVQRASIGPEHFNTVFWLCAGAGVLLYLIVLAISMPLADHYHDPMLATLLPVLGLRVIVDQLYVVPKALLSRHMAFRKIAVRAMAASLMAAAVCLGVLYAGYGLWALVLSQLVTSVVSCVVSWLSVDWRPSFRASRSAFRDMAGFGAYSSGSQIITSINIEQLMVGSLMGPAALGLLSFARRIYQMISEVMTGALGAVTYPLLASLQDETEKLRQAYLTATLLSSALAFPSFVGLAMVAGDLVPMLFGDQWREAVLPLRAFCAIGVLACIGILQSSLIRSKGRADIWMWYQLAQQLLTAVAVAVLYPYGIGAVAVGIAVKTWLVWPVTAVVAVRLIDLPMRRYLGQFLPAAGAAAVMALAILGLRLWLGPGPGTLLAQIGLGALCYGVAILLFARRRITDLVTMVRRRR